MKLSVWSSYFVELTPEEAIKKFVAHKYRYCELSDEHALSLIDRGAPSSVGKEFGDFANSIGMNLLQGHLFLNAKICIPKDRDVLKRQFDLFHAIGVKNAVLHCDNFTRLGDSVSVEYKREENEKGLSDLLDYIKDTDMVICLENLRPPRFTQSADDLMYFIERLNSKNLGICLDTGHLNLTPYNNQTEFIKRAGKNIKALHLADNDGLGIDQHLMPYARGVVDMETVIREMKKIGYDGLYNLESPGERHAPYEVLGYKLDYIKNVFDYIDRKTDEQIKNEA